VGHRLDLITRTQISGCRVPFLLTDIRVTCSVWKRLNRDHCCRGCRIVGSTTREKLTSWADFQFSFFPLTSDVHTYQILPDGSRACGGLVISEWTYQLSWAIIFSMTTSVATYRARGSMLGRTGNYGRVTQSSTLYDELSRAAASWAEGYLLTYHGTDQQWKHITNHQITQLSKVQSQFTLNQWFLTFLTAGIPWTRPMSSGTPKSKLKKYALRNKV